MRSVGSSLRSWIPGTYGRIYLPEWGRQATPNRPQSRSKPSRDQSGNRPLTTRHHFAIVLPGPLAQLVEHRALTRLGLVAK